MAGHEGAILELANTLLRDVKTTQTSASRIDYRIAKRCVEQAAFRVLDVASWPVPDPRVARCVAHVLSPQYVHAGLDLEIDADEGDAAGEHVPTWTISDLGSGAVAPLAWNLVAAPTRARFTAPGSPRSPGGGRDLVLREEGGGVPSGPGARGAQAWSRHELA